MCITYYHSAVLIVLEETRAIPLTSFAHPRARCIYICSGGIVKKAALRAINSLIEKHAKKTAVPRCGRSEAVERGERGEQRKIRVLWLRLYGCGCVKGVYRFFFCGVESMRFFAEKGKFADNRSFSLIGCAVFVELAN